MNGSKTSIRFEQPLELIHTGSSMHQEDPGVLLLYLTIAMVYLQSLVGRALRGLQRLCNGHIRSRSYRPNSTICDLPVEVLIAIGRYLEDPISQTLLSLSSRRLRAILTEYFDLSLTKDQKLEFLKILEPDLPGLLLCYECVRMFKWKRQKAQNYRCPGSFKLSASQHRNIPESLCTYYMHIGRRPSKEAVTLVLRAGARGPKFGLPPSALNHKCTRSGIFGHPEYHIRQLQEGQMVNGRFMLARSFILTGLITDDDISLLQRISDLFCWRHDLWKTYRNILETKETLGYREPWTLETIKCSDCATDMRVKIMRLPGETIRVEVDAWQDFGSCETYNKHLETKKGSSVSETTSDPTSRDLERDFLTIGRKVEAR